jgi:hypothetical protein
MDETALTITCWHCQGTYVVNVPTAGLEKWKAGAFIQNAMPELSISNRELLISNTCGECFDKLFPEDEEEEV